MQGTLVAEGAKRGEVLGAQVAPSLVLNVMQDLQTGEVPEGVSQRAFDELAGILARLN